MELIKIILIIVLIPLWVLTIAWRDSEHYDKEQWVKSHKSRVYSRFIIWLILCCFNPMIAMYYAFVFWALFDGLLNTFRGLSWFYVGSVASTDTFFSDKQNLYRFSKHISLILSVTLMVKIIEQVL